ncbi:MAG: fibronectin type III domain-containing protein [Gammaproteobacteria bacterium]|nr:fibronectin type III domain-containing protein [Gammaproteobacteria bacterium]
MNTLGKDLVYILATNDVVEEGETAEFELRRTGDGTESLVVYLDSSESRDMVSDDDLPESAAFKRGQTETTISILTENDELRENNSKVTITILPDETYYRSFALVDRTASVSITDNDTDDKIDLTFSNFVSIFNEGNSRFLERAVVTDFDGDASPDIFVYRRGNNGGQSQAEVMWIRNAGDGMFDNAETLDEKHHNAILEGDIDGDGDIDILIVEDGSTYYYKLIQNEGRGRFAAPVRTGITNNTVSGFFTPEKIVDMDGDRRAEIVLTGNPTASGPYCGLAGVLNYKEDSDPGMGKPVNLCADEIEGQEDNEQNLYYLARPNLTVGDLDGDGDMDFVISVLSRDLEDTTETYYSTLLVAGNEGEGIFGEVREIAKFESRGKTFPPIYEPKLSDMDGDGDIDVVWLVRYVGVNESDANDDEASLLMFENAGQLEFQKGRTIDSYSYEERDTFTINPGTVLDDFDGDRDIDILFYGADAQYRGYYPRHEFTLYQNFGDGTSFRETKMTNVVATDVKSADAIDVDLDGDFDLVVSSNEGIGWFENDSDHGDDYADETADAALISVLPGFMHGNLINDDVDLFEFNGGPGTLRVRAGGGTDTYGKILDSEGMTLTEDDDSGTNLNFELSWDIELGTYYLAASGYDATETGGYTLAVDFLAEDLQAVTSPSPPRNLDVVAGDGLATLSWGESESDGGSAILRHDYRVRTEEEDYGDWVAIPDSAPEEENATGYTVADLENGVRVLFQVRAVNEDFASNPSNEVGTTPKTPS